MRRYVKSSPLVTERKLPSQAMSAYLDELAKEAESLEGRIAAAEAAITTLQGVVTANTSAIAANAASISTNSLNISTNTTEIADLDIRVTALEP